MLLDHQARCTAAMKQAALVVQGCGGLRGKLLQLLIKRRAYKEMLSDILLSYL